MSVFSDIRYEDCTVDYEFHPIANTYPLLDGEKKQEFFADVVACGVRVPVVFFEGKILDGRNRYLAARAAGLGYPAVDYMLFDPQAVVRSLNDMRRHMPTGVRALAAAEMVNADRGRPSGEEKIRTGADFLTTAKAAEMAGVSERTVSQAIAVKNHGSQQLVDMVKANKVSLKNAEKLSQLPVGEQIAVITSADPKALQKVIKENRAKKQVEKKQRRADRERELSQKITALPDRKYGVILADPEWSFDVYSEETGQDRAAANHYNVSDTQTIAERDVGSIAAGDCVLFLWATVPMLPDALRVMEAWGFKYKSQAVWVKDRAGTGYWFRNLHEILLVGTKGSVPAPAMGDQFKSAINAPVGEHSAKPEVFLEMIEAYFPNLPKIELNRRGPARDGWDAWGNEAT